MDLLTDSVAKEIALRKYVLPECLHVPIAAVSEEAIIRYVGVVEHILAPGSPNRALVVRVERTVPPDRRLPIFSWPASSILHSSRQIWVHVRYTRYRAAYKRAFPEIDINNKVLSHALNRRSAELQGFQYVRITPVSRSSNSSSAFSENWGVSLHKTSNKSAARRKNQAQIQYADLTALMLMMDIRLGGGVMEIVNEGQKLIKPFGTTP